ncbi:hypothetical protein HPB50_027647 [Hyalomma asiaticum]|nr:hypothetical protein HPB50_027647 [Hyalomma asiaticum]
MVSSVSVAEQRPRRFGAPAKASRWLVLHCELCNRRYYLIPWIVWVSASCIILIILWCLRAIIAIKDQVHNYVPFSANKTS